MRIFLAFFLFTLFSTEVNSELLKPSPSLNPKQVISIQLLSLKNNDNPYKNHGIIQTWEFAHPKNKKYTGPLENFTKIIYSNSYIKILNHQKHTINTLKIFDNIAFFFVEIIDIHGSKFAFNWIVEKVNTEDDLNNCWMTISVSALISYGEST